MVDRGAGGVGGGNGDTEENPGRAEPRLSGALRLCRFCVEDDLPLAGFYEDDCVISIDQAAMAHAEAEEVDLILPASDDLLDMLPPGGAMLDSVRMLARWLKSSPDAPGRDELALPLSEVQLLVPIPAPPKILLLAGNYAAHVAERGGSTAERDETFPYVFMKPRTTLTPPGSPIVLPRCSPDHIDWECELGVVIGRRGRNIPEAEALRYVAGYTVVNDISDRRFRPNPGRKTRERDAFFDWMHGKWHDSFCPVGPCILPADAVADPQALPIRLSVNGRTRQDATTAQMVFPVAALIAFVSQFVTLEPGDLIATGTPAGVGSASGTYLRPGDHVTAEIPGIGRLDNPVILEDG